MDEKNIVIKDYEFFILATKEEGENYSQIAKKSIQFVNKKPLNELMTIMWWIECLQSWISPK